MKRVLYLFLLSVVFSLVCLSCNYMLGDNCVPIVVKNEPENKEENNSEPENNIVEPEPEVKEPENQDSESVDNSEGNEGPEDFSQVEVEDKSDTENLETENPDDNELDDSEVIENLTEKIPSEKEDEIKEPEMSEIENENQVLLDERQWTILIYMSADNNLESAAIEDLLEMEASKINTDVVSLFALVDRSASYNTSNDNWSGTRLYKIKTGSSTDSKDLISERIECKPLGISTDIDCELDMSSNYVLSSTYSYLMDRYPANHYGLIMWGHGTGWRNEADGNLEDNKDMTDVPGWKGFAYDETSGTYMTLAQFGNGLKACVEETPLDFIGFDTCYGGEIEVMYELRNYAKYGIGTEGLVSNTGWDYQKLLNYFWESKDFSPESFCSNAVKQFRESYKYSTRASIAVVNMNAINDYVMAFNNYCLGAASKITSLAIHDGVMGVLYDDENCATEKYTYGKAGYDIYLDSTSVIENLHKYFVSIKNSSDLVGLYSIFKNALTETFYTTWASDRSAGGLGVYFSTLTEGGYLASSHPSAYIKGKTYTQIQFVTDCSGYVPSNKNGAGLLDKLFYTSFK